MPAETPADFTAIMTRADGDDATDAPGLPLNGLPHAKEIGLRLISASEGVARLMVPYSERLIGDPATGVLHGGVITTLLDTSCGTAVMCAKENPISTATLDLRVDYLRSAEAGCAVFAEAECYRVARSIAFVRAVAFEADKADPVATAAGAFMVTRRPGAAEGA